MLPHTEEGAGSGERERESQRQRESRGRLFMGWQKGGRNVFKGGTSEIIIQYND